MPEPRVRVSKKRGKDWSSWGETLSPQEERSTPVPGYVGVDGAFGIGPRRRKPRAVCKVTKGEHVFEPKVDWHTKEYEYMRDECIHCGYMKNRGFYVWTVPKHMVPKWLIRLFGYSTGER